MDTLECGINGGWLSLLSYFNLEANIWTTESRHRFDDQSHWRSISSFKNTLICWGQRHIICNPYLTCNCLWKTLVTPPKITLIFHVTFNFHRKMVQNRSFSDLGPAGVKTKYFLLKIRAANSNACSCGEIQTIDHILDWPCFKPPTETRKLWN